MSQINEFKFIPVSGKELKRDVYSLVKQNILTKPVSILTDDRAKYKSVYELDIIKCKKVKRGRSYALQLTTSDNINYIVYLYDILLYIKDDVVEIEWGHANNYYIGGWYEAYLRDLGKRISANLKKSNLLEKKLQDELFDTLRNLSKFYRTTLTQSAKLNTNQLLSLLAPYQRNHLLNPYHGSWSFHTNSHIEKFQHQEGLTMQTLTDMKASCKAIKYYKSRQLSESYIYKMRGLLAEQGITQDKIDRYLPTGVIRNRAYMRFIHQLDLIKEEQQIYNRYQLPYKQSNRQSNLNSDN